MRTHVDFQVYELSLRQVLPVGKDDKLYKGLFYCNPLRALFTLDSLHDSTQLSRLVNTKKFRRKQLYKVESMQTIFLQIEFYVRYF